MWFEILTRPVEWNVKPISVTSGTSHIGTRLPQQTFYWFLELLNITEMRAQILIFFVLVSTMSCIYMPSRSANITSDTLSSDYPARSSFHYNTTFSSNNTNCVNNGTYLNNTSNLNGTHTFCNVSVSLSSSSLAAAEFSSLQLSSTSISAVDSTLNQQTTIRHSKHS